jgi:hypothetical protein
MMKASFYKFEILPKENFTQKCFPNLNLNYVLERV